MSKETETTYPIRIGFNMVEDATGKVRGTYIVYYYISKEDRDKADPDIVTVDPGIHGKITVYSVTDTKPISPRELAALKKSKEETIKRVFMNDTFKHVCKKAGIECDSVNHDTMKYLVEHMAIRYIKELTLAGEKELDSISENEASESLSAGYTAEDIEAIRSLM